MYFPRRAHLETKTKARRKWPADRYQKEIGTLSEEGLLHGGATEEEKGTEEEIRANGDCETGTDTDGET